MVASSGQLGSHVSVLQTASLAPSSGWLRNCVACALVACVSLSWKRNWKQQEIKKGQNTENKHAESRGQVGWALGWKHTTALSTSSEFIIHSGKQGGGTTLWEGA
jgi:hypothetical protein